MTGKKNLRSRFYIDQSVQAALTWRVVVHWCSFLVAGFCFGFVFQLLANPFSGLGQQLSVFWWNQIGFIMVLLFMTPIMISDTIKLSNRFAGPVYRLRDCIRRLNAGEEIPPVRFREGDFWQEMAEEFNTLADQLRASRAAQATNPQTQSMPAEVVQASA